MDASNYNIELRDKNGVLKTYLTPFVDQVSWEWNRIGGCGACSITIRKGYRDIVFDARDDIQIRIKSDSGGSKLVYRGYIGNVDPSLSNSEIIKLKVNGYFDLFKKIVVQDTGDRKEYTNIQVSDVVDDIIDNFVVSKTPITKGTIDVSDFEIDTIQFLTTVESSLLTLSELFGGVEYGVDENLVFFWREENTNIRHKFFIGDNVSLFNRRTNYDKLVNKVYLVGGTIDGGRYTRVLENADSQSLYYLSEQIINNGSIVTDTVADQYIGSILRQNSQPLLDMSAQIANIKLRLEDIVPIGLIVFFDSDYDSTQIGDTLGDIIGEAADGGSDITIGLESDGGDDVTIGGQYSAQINRIQYEMSDTAERFNINIDFGETRLETAALIKRLDMALANLNQY